MDLRTPGLEVGSLGGSEGNATMTRHATGILATLVELRQKVPRREATTDPCMA